MGFESSKNLIEQLQRQLGIDERLYAVQKVWESELGPLARHAEILGLKKGVLVIEADSNAVLHELTLRKREILNKLNQFFGENKFLKQIKLQIK
jgi:predicted nucleic acid-binding Zn ribbon protein